MQIMEGLVLNQQFAIEFSIQLALFLSSLFVMNLLVFKPLLELIHIREQKTHGLKDAAEKAKLKAEKLKADYENFIKAEHRTTSLWMDEERKKISEEEHRITQAARDDVGEKLNGLRKQINTDIEKARADLSPLISDFASRIASKLVGNTVSIAGIDSDLKKNLNNRPVVQG